MIFDFILLCFFFSLNFALVRLTNPAFEWNKVSLTLACKLTIIYEFSNPRQQLSFYLGQFYFNSRATEWTSPCSSCSSEATACGVSSRRSVTDSRQDSSRTAPLHSRWGDRIFSGNYFSLPNFPGASISPQRCARPHSRRADSHQPDEGASIPSPPGRCQQSQPMAQTGKALGST